MPLQSCAATFNSLPRRRLRPLRKRPPQVAKSMAMRLCVPSRSESGPKSPPSIKDQPKLAEADNMFDWLKQGAPAPTAAPPPAAGPSLTPLKAPGAVEATYIGSKVCLGCHSAVAATYATTLMGRLQRTGKSLECETCHGPGSAHAKAGGGRGVGGIISFRNNDLSRTAEENNAICLGCHERGQRVLLAG